MIEQLTIDLWARPQAPAAVTEQQVLPITPATIEGRYRAWRATPEGDEAYRTIERRVLADVAAGRTRISINLVVELVRAQYQRRIDNSFRALIARDLRDSYPELKAVIEVRQRGAT